MDTGQFPDVVELNVGGTPCTTLLSTLTSEDGSLLAAMFTGKAAVFKDKDGRYFIDADWNVFRYILEYLQNGGQIDVTHARSGFFGNSFEVSFGAVPPDMILALYGDAKRFRIKSLVEKLECHQNVLVKKQIDEFKQSVPFFEDMIGKILKVIKGETIMTEDSTIIQLCHDVQRDISHLCCEHKCFGVGFSSTQIQVPCKVTVPILECICKDLIEKGYSVNGRIQRCSHACKPPFSPNSNTCSEQLYLIQITLPRRAIQSSRQSLLGGTNQQQNDGFSFRNTATQFIDATSGSVPSTTSGGYLFGSSSVSNPWQNNQNYFSSNRSQFDTSHSKQQRSSGFTFGETGFSGAISTNDSYKEAAPLSFNHGSKSTQSYKASTQKQSNADDQDSRESIGTPMFGGPATFQNDAFSFRNTAIQSTDATSGSVPLTTSGGYLFGSSSVGNPWQNNQNFFSSNRSQSDTSRSKQQRSSGFTFGETGISGAISTNDSYKEAAPLSFNHGSKSTQSIKASTLKQSNADGQDSREFIGTPMFGGPATFHNTLSQQHPSLTQTEQQEQQSQMETADRNIFPFKEETTATKPSEYQFGFGISCSTPSFADLAASGASSPDKNIDVKEGESERHG